MSYSKLSTIAIVLISSFIGFGDRILPESIGQYSQDARTSLLGMLPSIQPQNNNAKTEEAIQNLEQP